MQRAPGVMGEGSGPAPGLPSFQVTLRTQMGSEKRAGELGGVGHNACDVWVGWRNQQSGLRALQHCEEGLRGTG